jgi:hypothetical protein
VNMTFFLPAHPSYFQRRYTQEQIDNAIRSYRLLSDRFCEGGSPFDCRYVFLREPGKSVSVRFDSSELGASPHFPKQLRLDKARKILGDELNRMVANLEALMDD